ncbi:MAG: GAF domain-containing protein [Planctomycetota bacterium]
MQKDDEDLERGRLEGVRGPWPGVDAEAVLDALLDATAVAVLGQDLGGRITLWNAGAEEMYGWAPAEVVGSSIERIIPADLVAEYRFLLERVSSGERVQELLTHRTRKDGERVDVSLTLLPISAPDGTVVGLVTTERDVTRRRRVDAVADGQRRLMETLARTGHLADGLQHLLDAVEGMTSRGGRPCIMHLKHERHVLVPLAARLPAPVDEALRQGVPIAPGGHPAGEAAFRRQAVALERLPASAPAWTALHAAMRANQTVACFSTPILSPGGEVLGTVDVYDPEEGAPSAEDLTLAASLASVAALAIERAESERDLRAQREVLSALYEINALIAAEMDAGRIINRVTEEATRLVEAQMGVFFRTAGVGTTGRFELQALAGIPRERFRSLPMPRGTPLFQQTLVTGSVQRFDDVSRDPRYGKNGPFHGTPAGHPPVRSYMATSVRTRSGDVLGLLLFGHEQPQRFTRWHEEIVRGIAAQTALALDTARLYQQASERALALTQADQRKNEFLAMLGHELRNPLGAMRSSLELLKPDACEGGDVAEQEALQILTRQARHMGRLVDDLLDVSRITQGKILLRRRVLDARGPIHEAVASARGAVRETAHRIEVSVPSEPVWVDADPVRLEQVVGNLLHNAIKFSEGGSAIHVEAEEREGVFVLTVRDEGQGIPPEQLVSIFDLFHQADQPTRSGAGGGLGLGLTLVRELARLHGGHVAARSPGTGQGSEFEVRLPIAPAPDDGTEASVPSIHGPLPVLRILLVEDQPDAARALAMLLGRWGHRVRHAATGADGLALAAERSPDVALLDVGLPDMDGWQLARRLREEPKTADIRIAALTGLGQRADLERSEAAGIERHFVKPVDPEALEAWLASIASRLGK